MCEHIVSETSITPGKAPVPFPMLWNGKGTQGVPFPMLWNVKHSFFGLAEKSYSRKVKGTQCFRNFSISKRFIYQNFYCSNGAW